ncbi:MAG: hypothetical protein WAT09_10620, partial [Paracoccaceae bacterium]
MRVAPRSSPAVSAICADRGFGVNQNRVDQPACLGFQRAGHVGTIDRKDHGRRDRPAEQSVLASLRVLRSWPHPVCGVYWINSIRCEPNTTLPGG